MRRVVLAGVLGAAMVAPVAPAYAAGSVDYEGLRIPVPAGWQVQHVGPKTCVRFDRHIIYLGSAPANQICPPHVVGRTEAMQVEPLTEQTDAFVSGLLDWTQDRFAGDKVARVPAGGLAGVTARNVAGREMRIAVPDTGTLITGSYGSDPTRLEQVLHGITTVPVRKRPAIRSDDRQLRRWTAGRGFDTCAAPSLKAMKAWRKAFVAANIYIGGAARACPDGNLSPSWVKQVRAMGWRLIPTYVGLQAPCTHFTSKFTAKRAATEGRTSAEFAVRRAKALGIPKHTPIYFDMEAYNSKNATCRKAVLTFFDAWTRRLKKMKYASGIYSSVGSGIRDLGNAKGIAKPSSIWFAHWDKKASVRGDRYLSNEWWPGHQRIKQHRGDHNEKHGGVTLNIDSDAVDGLVY